MQGHVEEINKTHLRDLMADAERCKSMMVYDSFSIWTHCIDKKC